MESGGRGGERRAAVGPSRGRRNDPSAPPPNPAGHLARGEYGPLRQAVNGPEVRVSVARDLLATDRRDPRRNTACCGARPWVSAPGALPPSPLEDGPEWLAVALRDEEQ